MANVVHFHTFVCSANNTIFFQLTSGAQVDSEMDEVCWTLPHTEIQWFLHPSGLKCQLGGFDHRTITVPFLWNLANEPYSLEEFSERTLPFTA